MKRITSLLLVAAMLLTMIGSAFAVEPSPQTAPMSLTQLQDALKGNGVSGTAIGSPVVNSNLGLHTVYKNISPDQIKKLKAFNVALDAFADPADYSQLVGTSGVSAADVKTLVKGIVQIMTFVTDQYKPDHLYGDTAADNKQTKILAAIDSVATKFYVPVNPADPITPTPGSAYDILNKISNNTMSKNAFGGIILDLKKALRKIIKEQTTAGSVNFPGVFVKDTSAGFINDPNAIIALTKVAAVRIFTNADSRTQLYLLKQGLKSKGMLTETGGVVDANSNFIKIIEAAFALMNAVDGNYDTAAAVANINLAGVLDVKLVDAVNQTTIIAEPNSSIDFTSAKTKVTFKVKPNPTSDTIENLNLIQNIDLTGWLDWAVYKGPIDNQVLANEDFNISYNSTDNTITVSTNSKTDRTGHYVLKLYRKVNAVAGNLPLPTNKDEIKDLFIEIPMSNTNPSSPGPGPSGPTYYNVITKPDPVEGGSTIVTNSNRPTGTFVKGTTVKIVATPNSGYTFVDWKIGGVTVSTSPEYTFTLNADTTAIASFKAEPLEKEKHNWYLRGYPDHSFGPEQSITRAEMAMVLYRLSTDKDKLNIEPKNAFVDVVATDWYAKAITFLKSKNIISGNEKGEFRPDEAITRAETAAMVSRFYTLNSDTSNPYTDVSKDHWAYAYIISATANNWFVGYQDSTFKPDGLTTRAETATMVNRVLNRKIELADIPDKGTMKYTDLKSDHWAYAAIMEATHTHKHTRKENGSEIWTDVEQPSAGFNE